MLGYAQQTLGSETLGSETLGSEALGSETLGSETPGSETLGSEILGSEKGGPQGDLKNRLKPFIKRGNGRPSGVSNGDKRPRGN